MEQKKYEYDSYNIYTIKTDVFKTCYIEVLYRNNVKESEITKRMFLNNMLTFTTKNFPTQKQLHIEYEELYNMFANGSVSRVGNSLLTGYYVSFINPKYAEKKLTEKAIKMLFSIISEPNITDGKFDEDSFRIIKSNMKADIESVKENPKSYAVKRMLEAMNKKSPAAIPMIGDLKDLEDITRENLVDTYNEVMNKDICDIYVIGDLDMDEVVKLIDKHFKNRVIKNTKLKLYLEHKPKPKVKTLKEKGDYTQAYLVMGCTLNNLTETEKHIEMRLYDIILGSGSLETKLARYLREDNSLCYNCTSIYQKYDNLLLICAGIDAKNYNLAVKLSKKSLKEMSSGKITKKELDAAKKYMISSLRMSQDSQISLINQYIFKNISGLPDVEERIKEIKKITVKDIITVAKKVKLDTVYLLHGGTK